MERLLPTLYCNYKYFDENILRETCTNKKLFFSGTSGQKYFKTK